RVEVADRLLGHADVRADEPLERSAVPVAPHVPLARRKDDALLVEVPRLGVQAGRAAAEVEMMRYGGAEPDDAALDEDRGEQEDLRYVLAALERMVVEIEVPFGQVIDREEVGTGPERGPDRSELHRDQLGLAHHVALAIEEGRRAVTGLADHGR